MHHVNLKVSVDKKVHRLAAGSSNDPPPPKKQAVPYVPNPNALFTSNRYNSNENASGSTSRQQRVFSNLSVAHSNNQQQYLQRKDDVRSEKLADIPDKRFDASTSQIRGTSAQREVRPIEPHSQNGSRGTHGDDSKSKNTNAHVHLPLTVFY